MMKYKQEVAVLQKRLTEEKLYDRDRIDLIENVVKSMSNDTKNMESKDDLGVVCTIQYLFEPINTDINNRVSFLSQEIKRTSRQLNTIKSIGEAKGESATIRIKRQRGSEEPKIKYGKASNFFKKINKHKIYRTERADADRYFRREVKENYDKITVAEATAELLRDLNDGNIEYNNKKALIPRLSNINTSLEKIKASVRHAMQIKDALAVSPVLLTEEEKKAVHRFYGTNAGAHFINTRLRNDALPAEGRIAEKYPNANMALESASAETPPGTSSAVLSAGQIDIIRKVFNGAYGVRDVMMAALHCKDAELPTDVYISSHYRGTHVPYATWNDYKKGDVLENTFVASFAPYIMKYARRDYLEETVYSNGIRTAMKFADKHKQQFPGSVPIIYEINGDKGLKHIKGTYEPESLALPGSKFEIVDMNYDSGIFIILKPVSKNTPANKMLY